MVSKFETVLQRTFETRRDEVTEGWRKFQNVEVHRFYISSNIISVIKLKKIRWVYYVACMRRMINAYRILIRNPDGKPNRKI